MDRIDYTPDNLRYINIRSGDYCHLREPTDYSRLQKRITPVSPSKDLQQDGASMIPLLMNIFANCAILTFLGVVLALSDFLEDGLDMQRYAYPKLVSAGLTLGPFPVDFAGCTKRVIGFLFALDPSGLLVTFLFGILPVIMVWRAHTLSL